MNVGKVQLIHVENEKALVGMLSHSFIQLLSALQRKYQRFPFIILSHDSAKGGPGIQA